MGESEAAGQGLERMNFVPCPAAAYVTCPGFGKYEPGAYPFVGPLARMFHGIARHEEAMRVGHGPFFWLFANVCVSARNKI